MAITMSELAKQLNLSQSTVSLVLNNRDKGRVRPELAAKIRETARATGFRRNRAAVDLRSRTSNIIGVAMAYSDNLSRAELVIALHEAITRRNYRPLFAFFYQDAEQGPATDLLLESNPAAIITLEPQRLPDHLNLPVVSFHHADPRFDAIINDVDGGIELTFSHLRQLGHHRIGWIGMTDIDYRSRQITRLAPQCGFELEERFCLKVEDPYAFIADPGCLDVWRDIPRAELPTAVLCHNDTVALSISRRLHDLGIRVPEEISLIGCDDIRVSSLLTPSLSSISFGSQRDLAERLVKRVLERLAAPDLPRRVEVLPARLVQRESVIAIHH